MRSIRKGGSVIGGAALVLFCTACAAPEWGASRDFVRAAGSKSKTKALNAMTYYAYGHLLERQGNFKRAAAQYRLALARQPRFPSAQNRLGITLNKLGKHAEASQVFRDVIEAAPGQAHFYNNLGFSLLLEGKYTQAEAALRRALELNPKFRRARMNCGIVLAKLGRDDEAFAEFARVGNDADANFNLAMVQIDKRMYERARESLRRTLALEPNMKAAQIQFDRLNARLQEDQTALAAEAVEQANAAEPTDAETPAEASPSQRPALEPVRITVAVEPSDQTAGDQATDIAVSAPPRRSQPKAAVVAAGASPAVGNRERRLAQTASRGQAAVRLPRRTVSEQPAAPDSPDVAQIDMGTALERAFANGLDNSDNDAGTAAVSHETEKHDARQTPAASAEIVAADADPTEPPATIAFEYPYPSATDALAATVESSSSLKESPPEEFDPLLPELASVALAAPDSPESPAFEPVPVGSAEVASTTPVVPVPEIETISEPVSTGTVLTSQAVQGSIGELLVEAEYLAELLFVVQDELGVDEAFALTGKIDALISEQMADIAALDDLRCTLLDREMSVAVAQGD